MTSIYFAKISITLTKWLDNSFAKWYDGYSKIILYYPSRKLFSPSFVGGRFIYINGGEAMKAILNTYKLVRKHAGATYIFILIESLITALVSPAII